MQCYLRWFGIVTALLILSCFNFFYFQHMKPCQMRKEEKSMISLTIGRLQILKVGMDIILVSHSILTSMICLKILTCSVRITKLVKKSTLKITSELTRKPTGNTSDIFKSSLLEGGSLTTCLKTWKICFPSVVWTILGGTQ